MAMTEGGYDANFVEEVLTDLKCVVCHYPFKKPVQIIQCGHRFCKECFKQMKDYSSTQNTMLRCPLDRMVINFKQVFPDKGLERTILNLKVRCSNVAKGCIWVNDLRDLQPHLDADCDYTIVTCQNEGCDKKIQRNMLQQHGVQCSVQPRKTISTTVLATAVTTATSTTATTQPSSSAAANDNSNDLSYNAYLRYRRRHPGPRSRGSYVVWRRLGGRDHEGFRWPKRPGQTEKKKRLKNVSFTFNGCDIKVEYR